MLPTSVQYGGFEGVDGVPELDSEASRILLLLEVEVDLPVGVALSVSIRLI